MSVNNQALLQLHTDLLCADLRHLMILPDILRWQQAEYERSTTLDKFEVMASLENLSDLFSEKISAVVSKVESVEQILFNIEMEAKKL